MIIQVAVGAMEHGVPQLSFDGSRIGVMPIGRDAVRHHLSDSPGRTKEGLCRCTVASLAQVDIPQIPIPIYSTVQVGPPTLPFKIGFVAVPPPASSPPPVLTEGLIQHGSKFRFPLPH